MRGLYIHIPFCRKKCHYCNFVVTTQSDEQSQKDFLDALTKEAERWRPEFEGASFDTVYLGGGTPSVLTTDHVRELFHILGKNFEWQSDAEITLECNPGDITKERAKIYKRLGVNRISLGVQSFNDATLTLVNRDHDADASVRAVEIFRDNGFKNISADLILALPGEKLAHVEKSLDRLFKMRPEHVSLYELVIEPGTVMEFQFKSGRIHLAHESEQLAMLSGARDYLVRHGYEHYELLSYAKPGFQSRHNRIYWDNEDYLGLGPGAFSYLKGSRFRFARNVEEYYGKIEKQDRSFSEEERLTEDKKEVESFLLALRLLKGADKRRFAKVAQSRQSILEDLQRQGLLKDENDRWQLTTRGILFAETVFSELS